MGYLASDGGLLAQLGQKAFGELGCDSYGVAVHESTSYEQLLERIGRGALDAPLRLRNDFAGAPFLADAAGEERGPFISLTDEDGLLGIAWVEPGKANDVVGVGVDLAVRGDFPFVMPRMKSYRRIFTDGELAAIHELCPHDLDLGATMIFSAKEAVLKGASQRIRHMFARCGGDLERFACPYFEVRDVEIAFARPCRALPAVETRPPAFLLVDGGWESRGGARIGDASAAFAFLGIGRFTVHVALYGDMVLAVAVAHDDA